jgi:hypothetical protein
MPSRGFWCIALAMVWLAQTAVTDEQTDLEGQVREVERKQDEIFQMFSSEEGHVGAFLKDHLSLGGFFETAISGVFNPNSSTLFSATPNNFAINLAADYNEAIRFNSQFQFEVAYPLDNPNNNPNASLVGLPNSRTFGGFTTSPTLPQAYLEYGRNPEFVVQVGRGYDPFGIAFQQRDLTLFHRRGGPQMIMANTSTSIAIASSALVRNAPDRFPAIGGSSMRL